jgi:hypothetical protein
MKTVLFFLALLLLGLGVYLKFFYDVPDNQAAVNLFTSWFLIIIGVAGLLINLFWSSSKRAR